MATPLTVKHLASISENPDPVAFDLAGDLKALAPEMKRTGITTKRRVAAFLATVSQETDRLKTLEEYGDEAYFRSFLGDQWRYHGRGYIMNTWRAAYAALSEVLGVDLLSHPDLLAKNKALAAKAAVWFWATNNINKYADAGNFWAVSGIVNTGSPNPSRINGWSARKYFYDRAMRILPDDLTIPTPKDEPVPDKPFVWPAYNPGPAPKPNSPNYAERHPTRYFFTPGVAALLKDLVKRFPGISVNTYVGHPPGWEQYERVSFDIWDERGRGYALDPALGDKVWRYLFDLPDKPYWEWGIWRGKMWTRSGGWQKAPAGAADSDPGHWKHIHISMQLGS